MPKRKKQHFVPKFYLKRFVVVSGLIDTFLVNKNKLCEKIPYKDQCQQDYFYGTDLEWEVRLSSMERTWDSIFLKIDKQILLSEEEYRQVKLFALFQRQRTNGEYNYRYQERKALMLDYAKSLYASRGWVFDKEAENLVENNLKDAISPSEMLELAQKMQSYIEDLRVLFVTYDTKNSLIISDVPVVAINPFHKYSIGYGCVGLVLLFPINPHCLAVIYDSKMYKENRDKNYISSTDESEVFSLNCLQFISAEELVLGCRRSFPEVTNNLAEIRNRNRSKQPVTTLGTPEQHLIAISMRSAIYDCELSFAHVNHAFRKIPFCVREGVERRWDAGWENKLRIKGQVMETIYKNSPESFMGYSCKDIRDGCNRFYREMQRYWASSDES